MPKRAAQLDGAVRHAMAEVARLGLDHLPPPVRTVLLVHTAQGIIDNGGLQYFFESDFPGQPPYSVFVDAYRVIGAEKEADALVPLQRNLARVPSSKTHMNRSWPGAFT